MRSSISLFVLLLANHILFAQKEGEKIRINQIGFYPIEQKLGIVLSEELTDFYLTPFDKPERVFSGKLSASKVASYSPQKTKVADFSAFQSPGTYVLHAGQYFSHPFQIKQLVLAPVAKGALKSFYFQRFSIPLLEEYAGKWNRPESSSHKEIIIHPSAVSPKRPAGTMVSSTKGWIDAGDYNKYVVNSGITTATLLSAYSDFSFYYDTLQTNIPESKNNLPDILDEVLWNLRWMLTMQDPEDGGVYHKCTNANFDGMVMPDKATTPRYMVQKSTAAALNFVAVMARASNVFEKFSNQLPGLSDSCRNAAVKAWEWAKKNPNVIYDQAKLNKEFDPDVNTGAYGDEKLTDEFFWAQAELAAATGNGHYLEGIHIDENISMTVPSWNEVTMLGYYALANDENRFGKTYQPILKAIKKKIITEANRFTDHVAESRYQCPMGLTEKDFVWGSNAVACNQGILMLQAYRLTHNEKYFNAAISNLDYILGRNATGYSFVTGFGSHTPMHIHHRPSEADGIEQPVPGLLAGGPNPGRQDKCSYQSIVPDEAYTDDVCSYASNEIAINWNAPLVYLSGAIVAMAHK